MTDLSLKLVIQALDKGATAGLRKFRYEVKGLSQEVKSAPPSWLKTGAAIDKTTTAAKKFNEAGRTGGKTLDALIERQRRLRQESARTESAWTRMTRAFRFSRGGGGAGAAGGAGLAGMAGGAGAMVGTAVVAGGAATLGAGYAGAKSVIATGAQFESYRATLKVIEGTGEKADKAMAWVTKFAKTTPYEVDQVMEAFVRLRAYGIDPTDGTLRALGDTSSAMQKDLMAAVEMMADAQTGEFERLKEFGIRASQQGDRVTFSYNRAGRDMTVTSKKTAAEIRRTLLGIFNGGFAGAMDEQSRTWNGMTSNLGDTWTAFKRKVADGGAFDAAKANLGRLLDFLAKAEADGRLDKWAGELSTNLGKLIDTASKLATEVNWIQLAKDITTVADAILALVRAGNQVGELFTADFWDFSKEHKGGQGPDLLYRYIIKPGQDRQAALKAAGKPSTVDWMANPWVYGADRRLPAAPAPARRVLPSAALPGLPGGPAYGTPAPKLKGDIIIGVAPGLEIRRADFGSDIDWRSGKPGDRP